MDQNRMTTGVPTACHRDQKPERDRVQHGTRGDKLPSGCRSIKDHSNRLRRLLEEAVCQAAGMVDLCAAARIQTICRLEELCKLGYRWLRLNEKELTASERLAMATLISNNSMKRDKVISQLRLDNQKINALLAGCITSLEVDS